MLNIPTLHKLAVLELGGAQGEKKQQPVVKWDAILVLCTAEPHVRRGAAAQRLCFPSAASLLQLVLTPKGASSRVGASAVVREVIIPPI